MPDMSDNTNTLIDNLNLTVTPYRGHEEEVLFLRNRNRQLKQTRQYLDWRYLGTNYVREPLIFWASLADGNRIGMAALIFRRFWIDSQIRDFAVLGDISVDKEFRRCGIWSKMLRFINSCIENGTIECSFVMPTPQIYKSFSQSGWNIKEDLISHVYILDPGYYVRKMLGNGLLARFLSNLLHPLTVLQQLFHRTRNFSIQHVCSFDASFDLFWENMSKDNLILMERTSDYLNWRYPKHPEIEFNCIKFLDKGKMIAYIVYNFESDGCVIYDLLVDHLENVNPVSTFFIRSLLMKKKAKFVRITLNGKHPYSNHLRKSGFFNRITHEHFLAYGPSCLSSHEKKQWFITAGDKDV